MPATVALHTLGECRITVTLEDRAATLTPSSDRLFTLALLLAAEPGHLLPRARAAAWLWPDLPPAAARHALRQLAYRLRRLGAPLDGDDANLTLAPHHVTSADATAMPLAGPPRTARCLPDWDPPGDALADWVDRYRARTEAAARDALARALQTAPAPSDGHTRLAAALRELDPHHPLARAALPPPTRVRETPHGPDALPLVGRDEVLATLREHAADARAGRARAVALATPPGAGVTRILRELATVARAAGLTPLPDSAPPPAPDGFAGALAATVRALFARPGALGCAPHTLRVLRRFATTPHLPHGDAPLRRLGAAIAELARAVAAEHPLLLAVDARCTWLPERALAAALARDLAGSSALAVVVTPAADPPLPQSAFHTVALCPLRDADAARLATAAARASGHTIGRDDLAWCVTTAGGRPGDLIALASACAQRPGARELPPPIAARLRDALATLPQRTRDVAALHAQFGDRATPDALARALGRRPTAVHAALATLERAGLPALARPGTPTSRRRAAARAFNTAILAALP